MDAFDIEMAEAAEQRSEAWRDVRAGRFTASEIFKLMTDPRSKEAREKGEWSDGAMTYILTKVAEDLTGQVHQASNAYPMVYGTDMEPLAKEYFTLITGKEVKFAGFKTFTEHAGGSPDGYVDEDAIIEIKCPFNSANQINYLRLKSQTDLFVEFPEYWWQCQANMAFNRLTKCYFVTYDPRFKDDNHKLKILELQSDVNDQERMLARLDKAIETKLDIIKSLT